MASPREVTPKTRPEASNAGPPESPEHTGLLPTHSSWALAAADGQLLPTQYTDAVLKRMRVPAVVPALSFGSWRPKPTAANFSFVLVVTPSAGSIGVAAELGTLLFKTSSATS